MMHEVAINRSDRRARRRRRRRRESNIYPREITGDVDSISHETNCPIIALTSADHRRRNALSMLAAVTP